MRGGPRPNAGRPKGAKGKKTLQTPVERVTTEAVQTLQAGAIETPRFKTALEFAMHTLNDPLAEMDAKVRLAIAAMPFQHPKLEAVGPGKKDQQDAAAREVARRFTTPQPPASAGEADSQRLLT